MNESEQYDRLLRLISDEALELGLMLARYENAVLARRTWERAAAEAGERGREIAIVNFTDADDEVDMLARLAEAAAQADVVFAVGLEGLLVELGEPRASKAITTLNFNRDLMPERVGKPVVLWLSYRAARAFALRARDTFDIIRTSFEFPEVVQAEVVTPTHDMLPYWMLDAPDSEVLHLEERAGLLESLFADAEPDSAAAADLAASLARIEFALGHHEEGLAWSETAAQAYEVCDDLDGAATHRVRRARMYTRLGELDRAMTELDVAANLADRADNVVEQVEVLHLRAHILMLRGQPDEALELLDGPALAAYEEGEYEGQRAVTHGFRADIFEQRGQLDEALRVRRERELPVYERLGADRERAMTLAKIARILEQQGELDEALRIRREQVLPVFERVGAIQEWAVTMEQIADTQASRGELDEAVRIRRKLLPEHKRHGDLYSALFGAASLAVDLAARGHPEDQPEIEQLLTQAHEAAKKLNIPELAWIEQLVAKHVDPAKV